MCLRVRIFFETHTQETSGKLWTDKINKNGLELVVRNHVMLVVLYICPGTPVGRERKVLGGDEKVQQLTAVLPCSSNSLL